jgi:hypothetical protein
MTIEQITTDIDQLEQMVFYHSLQSLKLEELEQMREKVKRLKEAFLGTYFVSYRVEVLEEIRFKLAEITVSIEINIKEQLRQNATADIRKLEGFYRTA